MHSSDKPHFPNKPKFGILRVQGDIKLPSNSIITKILNNPDKYPDEFADLEEKIKLSELWKLDEVIHQNQFKKPIDINQIPKPQPPKKLFGLLENTNDPEYIQNIQKYEKQVQDASELNAIINLYNQVKVKYNHTCYFCGFEDPKYIEIHNLDGDHHNNDISNLVTACTLCHRQHHLLWLSQYNHAELGVANVDFMPQVEFNHIQRISIVMSDNPEYKMLLGQDGKLGSIIRKVSNNFSKPLHAFMMPESEKQKEWLRYLSNNKITYQSTENAQDFTKIEAALDVLNNTSTLDDKAKKNAMDAYDSLINIEELKKIALQKNQQGGDAIEDTIRNEHKSAVGERVNKFKEDYQIEFESKFNEDKDTFNLFELAMALKSVEYSNYETFDPKYMFLVFNPSIFTKEQIEYYKTLEYFNISNWGFGDR